MEDAMLVVVRVEQVQVEELRIKEANPIFS
jgi:hypothetical protein